MAIQIDSTHSKAGGTSLLIPGGTNATATQSGAALKANRVYLAQCWVMTDGNVLGSGSYGAGMWGTVDSGTLQIITTTGSSHGFGSTYFDVELAATAATDWTLLQSVFQTSADCTLTLHLQNGVGGGSVGTGNTWFDIMSVTDVTGQVAPSVAVSTSVAQQNSADYLTNSDKTSLMQQYKAELQTKAQLDAQASSASVSATNYDNAVAAISTTLTGAGAPTNWATLWPDGITSGPWSGIKTSLTNAWANVALYRATLQNAIGSAQAAAQANNALNAAIKAAQPHIVSWSYSNKPALPSADYPAGYYAITTDYRTVQVSSAGSAWVDIFIAANGLFGSITAGQLAANAIQTTNYAEDGSGNPTAGAKMQIGGTALKVASGNLQIGSYLFNDWMLPRIAQALDGNSSNGTIFYRGNNDVTTRGGAPNINCLAIQPHSYERVNSNFQHGYWTYTITPTSYSTLTDNLDGLRALRIRLYQTSTSTSPFQDVWFPITDRGYDGSTGVVKGSFSWGWREGTDGTPSTNLSNGSSPYLYNGYIRATLYNAYGASADVDFAPGNTPGANLSTTTITGQSGSTTGSGSGSAGGACPAPWLPVMLASGLEVPASDLYDGALVIGIDETGAQATGTVRHPQRIWSKRLTITLQDGRSLIYSLHHRKLIDSGWVAVEDLKPGDTLLGIKPGVVTAVSAPQLGEVITFEVEGCHTYQTDGTLDHNVKANLN